MYYTYRWQVQQIETEKQQESTIIIKLKSRLSVCLSVRTFLVEWISAIGGRIDVKLARNEAPVFLDDKVYF